MAVSFELFDALQSYDNYRRKLRSDFLNFKKNNERYAGSEGYKKDLKAAREKRKKAEDEAREKAGKRIDEALKRMRENLSKKAIVPPTPEQVSILQLLSMRTKISKTELDRAAQAMNGNQIALAALNDIADKHYFVGSDEGQHHTNYNTLCSDLSDQAINDYMIAIAGACKRRLKTSAKDVALQGATFQYQHGGVAFDEDDLPQKPELVSERQFYGEIISDSDFEGFMKAVNDK